MFRYTKLRHSKYVLIFEILRIFYPTSHIYEYVREGTKPSYFNLHFYQINITRARYHKSAEAPTVQNHY